MRLITWPFAVAARLLFVVFVALGGFLFLIPKWIIMGTKAGRERRALLRETRRRS